jgi:hypothetical protein
MRNRVIGAVRVTARPELEEQEEETVGQQLSLLDVDKKNKRKRSTRSRKGTKG